MIWDPTVSRRVALAALIIEYGQTHYANTTIADLKTKVQMRPEFFAAALSRRWIVFIIIIGLIVATTLLTKYWVSELKAPEMHRSDHDPSYAESIAIMGVGLAALTACLTFASTLYLSLWQSLTDSLAALVERIDNANRNSTLPATDELCVELKQEAISVVEHFAKVIGSMRLLFWWALFLLPVVWGWMLTSLIKEERASLYNMMVAAALPTALIVCFYYLLIFGVQILGPIPEKVRIQRALDYILYDDRLGFKSVASLLIEKARKEKYKADRLRRAWHGLTKGTRRRRVDDRLSSVEYKVRPSSDQWGTARRKYDLPAKQCPDQIAGEAEER